LTFNPFTHQIININKDVNLHIIELQEITDEIKNFIDSKIVNVTNGTRNILPPNFKTMN